MRRRSSKITRQFLQLLFLGLFCALILVANGCATGKPPEAASALKSEGAPAEQLSRKVNEWHDSALVPEKAPFIFDEAKVHDFARTFIARACPEEMEGAKAEVSSKCNRRFGAAVAEVLHEHYFAADIDAVQDHCRADPLTCEDARTFEVLFRQEHNAGIERSRADKLEKIREWKAGQIGDQALQQALHFQFALSNGEVVAPTKEARAPAGG